MICLGVLAVLLELLEANIAKFNVGHATAGVL